MSASQMQVREAGLQLPTVLVEFDRYDIARSAHESEAYQKALQALGSGAERDFRIVEGAWPLPSRERAADGAEYFRLKN
jgi:uncharacterized protein (DUF1330 family)